MSDASAEWEGSQKAGLFCRMVGECEQLTQELNNKLMKEFSLSLAKYDVLKTIDGVQSGNIRMSDLSRELGVSNANMTGMISRLQSSGLVEKKVQPSDRRIYSINLTEIGRCRLKEADKKHLIWVLEFMSGINNAELVTLSEILDKIGSKIIT